MSVEKVCDEIHRQPLQTKIITVIVSVCIINDALAISESPEPASPRACIQASTLADPQANFASNEQDVRLQMLSSRQLNCILKTSSPFPGTQYYPQER